jgi:hypothetical protein
MSNVITLSQVAAMQDDAWLNDPVHAVLSVTAQRTSKAGKPFWSAVLTDPNDPSAPTVATTFFADPSRYNGQLVSIEGKGSKKGSYNGKPQINIGKTAFVKVLGAAGATAPTPAASRTFIPPPAASSIARPAYSADGAKTGGCVARAMEAIAYMQEQVTEDSIVQYAGMFLRATTRLEQGEWAQQAAQPVKRPQPGPGGSVNTDDSPEDVPY